MRRSRSILLSLFATATLAILSFVALTAPVQASTSDNFTGYAWSSNIGWVKMNNCDAAGSCGSISYGVTMATSGPTRNITGYAWSSNIGWISFNPQATTNCPPTNTTAGGTSCQARVEWGANGGSAVKIKGWARACSVFPDGQCGSNGGANVSSGWDGWISLGDSDTSDSANFGITMDALAGSPTFGSMSGFAWGSGVVGWLNFNQVKFAASTTYECSDGVDNADTEDTLIDAADPGCHTDFDATNAASYVATDPDESNAVCAPGTFPNNIPGNPPSQPKWCTACTNLPETQTGNPPVQYPVPPAGYTSMDGGMTCTLDVTTCPPGQHIDPITHQCVPNTVSCPPGTHLDPATNQCVPDTSSCPRGQHYDPVSQTCVDDNGGSGDACLNIPGEQSLPVLPPYRQVGKNCLCVAGYVLNAQYQCVRPTYNEF